MLLAVKHSAFQTGVDEEDFDDIIMKSKARLMRTIYVPKPKQAVSPVATEVPAEKQV